MGNSLKQLTAAAARVAITPHIHTRLSHQLLLNSNLIEVPPACQTYLLLGLPLLHGRFVLLELVAPV